MPFNEYWLGKTNRYPIRSTPLPSGLSDREICHKYPNHLRGDVIVGMYRRGFEAAQIYEHLPEEIKTTRVADMNTIRSSHYSANGNRGSNRRASRAQIAARRANEAAFQISYKNSKPDEMTTQCGHGARFDHVSKMEISSGQVALSQFTAPSPCVQPSDCHVYDPRLFYTDPVDCHDAGPSTPAEQSATLEPRNRNIIEQTETKVETMVETITETIIERMTETGTTRETITEVITETTTEVTTKITCQDSEEDEAESMDSE